MRILLIEDDSKLCETLAIQLKNQGFEVDTCLDGEEGLYYIEEQGHDLILLDRMLPGINGFEILKEIRRKEITTPVILLTAMGELNDKIDGLDAGADDYIVKPFAFEELMARIRCIRRRPEKLQSTDKLLLLDASLLVESHVLEGPTSSCSLSQREYALLEVFFRHPGESISRERLLNIVWGLDSEVEAGNLDNYIYFVRRRLKAVGSHLVVKTIRGIGYALENKEGTAHA